MYKMPLYIDAKVIKKNFYKIEKMYNKTPDLVLKSNAYGFGIENIVPIISTIGCKRVFVADIQEALRVRALNQKLEIVIFGAIGSQAQTHTSFFLDNKITPTINDIYNIISPEDYYQLMISKDKNFPTSKIIENIKDHKLYLDVFQNVPSVLEINIGMNRGGIDADKVEDLLPILKSLPIFMIMAHLNITSELVMNPINRVQKQRFEKVVKLFPTHIQKSLCASNVLNFGDDFIYDAPRIGKALYGLTYQNHGLEEAFSFIFPLSLVRYVSGGEIVGYNGYVVEEDMYVGLLDIGYAHGLNLLDMNHMYVEWQGEKFLIISISMEYTFIKFPLHKKPARGDNIRLFPGGFLKENFDNYSILERLLRFAPIKKEILNE